MKKYTKKPVIIEAIQLLNTPERIRQVTAFIDGKEPETSGVAASERWNDYLNICAEQGGIKINTLESHGAPLLASFGDYVIKGIKGEFYPCRKDIFYDCYIGEQSEEINLSPIELLTKLQAELGYKKGELSTVAMLGLVGEAGEVLGETMISIFNDNQAIPDAIRACAAMESLKKRVRSGDLSFSFELSPEQEARFDMELADTLGYVNALAINRGLTIFDLAQMLHYKIKRKQAEGGSSEDRKS